jgi:hypothetical protein
MIDWRRVIVVTVITTFFVLALDHFGVINGLAKVL